MSSPLPPGVPREDRYLEHLGSPSFTEIAAVADQFLVDHAAVLPRARGRVNDSFRQWSRQWEYPFASQRLISRLRDKGEVRILDAGCGVTFFPFHLMEQLPDAQIHCCDLSPGAGRILDRIPGPAGRTVEFAATDLRALPYEDGSFDAVYCISVLEHTEEYPTIIDEFWRVLRPGGSLVLTFDVSIDGTVDIDIDGGTRLLETLTRRFDAPGISLDLRAQVTGPDVFTTASATRIDRGLLPWSRRAAVLLQLKRLATARRPVSWPPLMTVFCAEFTRPE